jgi:hypothetical protein
VPPAVGDHVGDVPDRQVRALFDERTLTVYQAFRPEIADPALAAGTFVAPFKTDRMTWIKPSFLWMMYRCGWAEKAGQERVLAIRVWRDEFDRALAGSCLSHFRPELHDDRDTWRERLSASPVRVQWDPERNLRLERLPWRTIQVGLSGPSVTAYLTTWIAGITDVTPLARRIRELLAAGAPDDAARLLPTELPYPLPVAAARATGAD